MNKITNYATNKNEKRLDQQKWELFSSLTKNTKILMNLFYLI